LTVKYGAMENKDEVKRCAWCFKKIDCEPIAVSYDLDLPTIYFHDKNEEIKFDMMLFYMSDPDNFLKREWDRNKSAYEKELKSLARHRAKDMAKNKTA